jgi:YD repeat-containing protein
MKNFFYLLLTVTLFSCGGESLEEGFEDANDNVSEKLLKQIRIDYADPYEDDYTYQFGYDGDNRLTSVTDGENTRFFNYDSGGDLTSISGSDEPFEMSELYEAPYDAFEEGDVLEYDDKGNPIKIEVYDDGDYYNDPEILVGEISYDQKPNPFFYTLEAGGIIDVLNNVDLNFNSSSPTIVKAYRLLPFNNVRGMIFRNSMDNQIETEVQYESVYDEDGYATNTTIQVLSDSDNETVYLTYVYR